MGEDRSPDTDHPTADPGEGLITADTRTADAAAATQRGEPDRPPTEEEEQLADEAAGSVDVEEVGRHYGEMAELGAQVEGEGRI